MIDTDSDAWPETPSSPGIGNSVTIKSAHNTLIQRLETPRMLSRLSHKQNTSKFDPHSLYNIPNFDKKEITRMGDFFEWVISFDNV
jgi:hypothetical protein